MKLDLQKTDFITVEDIHVPDEFYRRFKTGNEFIDSLFGGGGFLPGSSFTLAGGPGSGKSTFLLQICGLLAASGKKVAYISGEESIVQISFTCKRIGVTGVKVSNMTDAEDICNQIDNHKFDFVIIDSFPTLRIDGVYNSKKREEVIVDKICSTAKRTGCVVGLVQHVTKQGKYKGSTLLPHSVDCNVIMQKNEEDPDNIHVRDVMTTKNRFGPTSLISINLTESGFDLNTKSKPTQKKDPLDNVKVITIQEATKVFGTYYNAMKYFNSNKSFVKQGKQFVRA
jgi:DNA repair protein RadA/Sms